MKTKNEGGQGKSKEEDQTVTSVTAVSRHPCAKTQELPPRCGKSIVWEGIPVGLIVCVCLVFQCRATEVSAWPAHHQ